MGNWSRCIGCETRFRRPVERWDAWCGMGRDEGGCDGAETRERAPGGGVLGEVRARRR